MASSYSSCTSSIASKPIEPHQTMMSETFETLSGTAFIKMESQDITALSRDALLSLVFRCKAIVTAIATLSTDTTFAAKNPLPVVAQILDMQPKEIVTAVLKQEQESSSTTSTTSLPVMTLTSSEPLPWRPNTRPKLPPGALLDIDQGPFYDIITEWLRLEDICHLDSALCQRWRRAEFLALVSTKILLFNKEEIVVLTDPYPYELYPSTHRALGAAALNWILKRGIHLASLRLPRLCFRMNEVERKSICDAITSLVLNGHLDKLETISLSCCDYIKDDDLARILLKCCRSVKSIDIRGCDLTKSAAAHIKCCTKLEAFDAKGNESAADMAEIFQACRKLRKVDLSGFGGRHTDKVVLSVADHCHLLVHLDLGSCYEVSNAAVKRGAESCALLQFVNLSDIKLNDATVVWLCNRCPLLKRLFLACCYSLTDAAVLAVAEGLPGLTHIDLIGITAITSSAVETLASKCRELEFVDLSYNTNINDVTLAKIAQHCSKLEDLRVFECASVTAVGLTYILTKFSELKSVYTDYEDHLVASLKQLFPHIVWGTY